MSSSCSDAGFTAWPELFLTSTSSALASLRVAALRVLLLELADRRQRLGTLAELVLRVGLPVERGVGLVALQLDDAVEAADGAIPSAGVERALALVVIGALAIAVALDAFLLAGGVFFLTLRAHRLAVAIATAVPVRPRRAPSRACGRIHVAPHRRGLAGGAIACWTSGPHTVIASRASRAAVSALSMSALHIVVLRRLDRLLHVGAPHRGLGRGRGGERPHAGPGAPFPPRARPSWPAPEPPGPGPPGASRGRRRPRRARPPSSSQLSSVSS